MEQFDDMVKKGLAFVGKSQAVFSWINMLATTKLYKPDEISWACLLALRIN